MQPPILNNEKIRLVFASRLRMLTSWKSMIVMLLLGNRRTSSLPCHALRVVLWIQCSKHSNSDLEIVVHTKGHEDAEEASVDGVVAGANIVDFG